MKPATKRKLKRWFGYGFFAFALIVLLTNRWVVNSTNGYLYTNWALLPENDVGLVMGTSPYRSDGKSSAEFYGRMRAAAQLYQLGKVKHLIVSGANPDSTYNEPRQMLKELVRLGVKEDDVTMDFAGFRTLDSITRANVVFGLKRFTIITTRYHAWRSLFIARKLDLNAVAFAAPIDVTGDYGKRNPWREILARTLAVFDVFLLGTEPTVKSEPQAIKIDGDAEKI